jgi:hypothetical protein
MKMEIPVLARRQVLRGMMAGSAISVGLPILDCILNSNGDAFAATGKPLPARFATWFWGCGLGEGNWTPKAAGKDYELPVQLEPLKPFQKRMTLFSGSHIFLDGQTNNTHTTGAMGITTGSVGKQFAGSLDTIIGDVIGKGTRFRSIEVGCNGDPGATWSVREGQGRQPAEISPVKLYTRIFGPEYIDPNAAVFTPDPQIMIRHSVLSGVKEERDKLNTKLGAADKAKLDNYFTSLRSLEQKLEVQLQKPDPLEACTKPDALEGVDKGALSLATEAMARHNIFASLLAHALACGQTRVVNVALTQGISPLRREGDSTNHHAYTHEEPIDPELGYQVKAAWFQTLYMQALHDFAKTLDGIQEGDKTLLDRMLVFAFTDHGAPRLHSVRNYPLMLLGTGDGRVKTGMHLPRPGDTTARIAFTVQQAMGVPVSAWGTGSNRVNSAINDIMV